jgi:hypothetical protein
MRSADGSCTRLRETKVQNFAFSDQIFDRSSYVFDWYPRIDPVLVVEVNVVGSKALQRVLYHFPDVLWLTIKNAAILDVEAKFGCDSDLITNGLECFPDEVFVGIGTVNLGGIEKRDLSWAARMTSMPWSLGAGGP